MEAPSHGLTIASASAAVLILCFFGLAASAPPEFIRTSCKATQYPDLCENSLARYGPTVRHSPRQLAHAALTVTTEHAVSVSIFVHRMSSGGKRSTTAREGVAVRDCMETLSDSVDRLRRSMKEMEQLGRSGSSSFKWHLSNVKTWVSAALTDENTCLESLSQDKSSAGVRPEIRQQVVAVSKLTSNALALVNRLGS